MKLKPLGDRLIVQASEEDEVTASAIVLPDTSVYVGVHYDSTSHFVCGDRSTTTTQRPVYHSGNGSSSRLGSFASMT